jgi:hypothetical protein
VQTLFYYIAEADKYKGRRKHALTEFQKSEALDKVAIKIFLGPNNKRPSGHAPGFGKQFHFN